LLDSGQPGPINIGTVDEVSMSTLATQIVRLAGSRSEIIYTARPADDPEMRRPDLTLAEQLLGYAPSVSSGDGLRRTIEYFAERIGVPAPAYP